MGSQFDVGLATELMCDDMATKQGAVGRAHSRLHDVRVSGRRHAQLLAALSAAVMLLPLVGSSFAAAAPLSGQLVSGVNHSRSTTPALTPPVAPTKCGVRHSAPSPSSGATHSSPCSSLLATPSVRSRPPVIASLKQGVYVGPLDPTGVVSFARLTNTKVTIASDFLPGAEGWNGVDGANGSVQWVANAWKSSGYTLSLGVPMIPTDSSGHPQGTLAQGAAGAYNSYFTQLANRLVAIGEGNAYLRLGWEFDGTWYAWQAQGPTAEAAYAAYYRNVVISMRSVPGAAFKFVWNPDASAFGFHPLWVGSAYPGNAYVDVIGLELYDWNWGPPETPQAAWKYTFFPQLSNALRFARSRGKPLALSEWGVVIPSSHGFGDDPYFITHMIAWMKSPRHDVTYESYFNGNTLLPGGSPDLNLLGGNFPRSLSAFAASLG